MSVEVVDEESGLVVPESVVEDDWDEVEGVAIVEGDGLVEKELVETLESEVATMMGVDRLAEGEGVLPGRVPVSELDDGVGETVAVVDSSMSIERRIS